MHGKRFILKRSRSKKALEIHEILMRATYGSSQTGVIGEHNSDDRLYVKEFVIGVEVEGQTAAFPFSALNNEPVVNAELGETPFVVVFSRDTGTGVAFDRRVDGQVLTFSQESRLQMSDNETGVDLGWPERRSFGRASSRQSAGAVEEHGRLLVCLEGLVPEYHVVWR